MARSTRDSGARGGVARVPITALRRLAGTAAVPAGGRLEQTPRLEHCDLCGEPIPPDHRHLLDHTQRSLACACQACTLLFEREGAANGKYILVPRRYLALGDFRVSDEQWDDLMIPVGMAFIYRGTAEGRAVAYYPSPAGATESLLSLERWEALLALNPILRGMAPDVEALLINRMRDARDYFVVPIDTCYELVGLIRSSWRGLSGGTEVWATIAEFFARLRAKSETASVGQAGEKGALDAGPEL